MFDINLLTRQEKIKLLLATVFLVASIVFFAYSIQRYQVLTKSRAEEALPPLKTVTFTSTSDYGHIINVPFISISDITQNEIITRLKQDRQNNRFKVPIRLTNPALSVLENQNFKDLSADARTIWIFSFADFTAANTFYQSYQDGFTNQVFIELSSLDVNTKQQLTDFLSDNPTVGLLAPDVAGWQPSTIKSAFEYMAPPDLDAASFTISFPIGTQTEFVRNAFSNFYNASNDIPAEGQVKINYPAGASLALTRIFFEETVPNKFVARLGVLSAAMISSAQTTVQTVEQFDPNNLSVQGKAAIRYFVLGEYGNFSDNEREFINTVIQFPATLATIAWPPASPENNNVWNNNITGLIGKPSITAGSDCFIGLLINHESSKVRVQLPQNFKIAASKSTRNEPVTPDAQNIISFEAYEAISFNGSFQAAGTEPTATPTLPPEAAGQLVCDAGPDPYNSNTIRVFNNTDKTITDLEANVHRCIYRPGKIKKSFYKCETAEKCDPNDPNCDHGVWDQSSNQFDISIAPGEWKTFTMTVKPCEIAQLDVQTHEQHVADSVYECYNVGSQYTDPLPPSRWQGGISFAIQENSEGYDNATGTCPVPTTPVPTTPVPTTPVPTTPVPTTPIPTTLTSTPITETLTQPATPPP